jgi:hypothetical protein
VPFALYYLSVAPLHSIVYDIVLYPARYYHRGRNLPFPGITLRAFENIEIYLLAGGSSLLRFTSQWLLVSKCAQDHASTPGRHIRRDAQWRGFLFSFALLALAMYFKGFVRISLLHLYLCIIPSLLLVAVLFEHRFTFPRILRSFYDGSGLAGCSGSDLVDTPRNQKVAGIPFFRAGTFGRGPCGNRQRRLRTAWCETANPLTRGFCFWPMTIVSRRSTSLIAIPRPASGSM